jgi:hypothetical protein
MSRFGRVDEMAASNSTGSWRRCGDVEDIVVATETILEWKKAS